MEAILPDPFGGFLGVGTLLFPASSSAKDSDATNVWTPIYSIKDLSNASEDHLCDILSTLDFLLKCLFIAVSRRHVDATLILRIYIIPNDSALRLRMRLNENRILHPGRQRLRKLLSHVDSSPSLWHGDLTGCKEGVGSHIMRKAVSPLSLYHASVSNIQL